MEVSNIRNINILIIFYIKRMIEIAASYPNLIALKSFFFFHFLSSY